MKTYHYTCLELSNSCGFFFHPLEISFPRRFTKALWSELWCQLSASTLSLTVKRTIDQMIWNYKGKNSTRLLSKPRKPNSLFMILCWLQGQTPFYDTWLNTRIRQLVNISLRTAHGSCDLNKCHLKILKKCQFTLDKYFFKKRKTNRKLNV